MSSHVSGLKRQTNQLAYIRRIFARFGRPFKCFVTNVSPGRHQLFRYPIACAMNVQGRSTEKGLDYSRRWDGEYILSINISKKGWGYDSYVKIILDKGCIFASPKLSANHCILLSLSLIVISFSFPLEYEKKNVFAVSLSWVMSWKVHVWWWTATNPGNWTSNHTFNQCIVMLSV